MWANWRRARLVCLRQENPKLGFHLGGEVGKWGKQDGEPAVLSKPDARDS